MPALNRLPVRSAWAWERARECHRCGDSVIRLHRQRCQGCALMVCEACRAFYRVCVDCGDVEISVSCFPNWQIPLSESANPRFDEIVPPFEWPALDDLGLIPTPSSAYDEWRRHVREKSLETFLQRVRDSAVG